MAHNEKHLGEVRICDLNKVKDNLRRKQRRGVSSLSVWARGESAEGDAGAEAEAGSGAREAAGGGVNVRP
ncbi:unnamed protein product [Euphydryas editha]|uniref:Uncharacterized protein n=1 Tax=Euphydryas editha TaxID=104508 RepID=A0AAU9TH17_EUPED|nr:unnamed protein product [Euphydryas editha]